MLSNLHGTVASMMAEYDLHREPHFRSLFVLIVIYLLMIVIQTECHPYSASSKKTCPTCAACPPPCAATAASTPPPNTCQDNPCYLRSLPFLCSAQQCQEFINSTNGNGKAIIVDLPDKLCITTCQMQWYNNNGFMIHRFGACTRYKDLAVLVGQFPSGAQSTVSSYLTCGSDYGFSAIADQIFYARASGSPYYHEDTILQCTLALYNTPVNELYAATDFKMNIRYVPEDQCGKVSSW
ncbi:uncharacterized protein LOC129589867 [Paramacrobiotus metropolitanus]|uniref:uncharacterized protein LOC129589867 n=1 Tax=Paramacrobiotus metropolitanus TaxID=2943436 RepID=UPI002445BE8B|nr:uncharacterized protein LOC129589867 [Paramacrobiotus metropolitanus]